MYPISNIVQTKNGLKNTKLSSEVYQPENKRTHRKR